MQAETKQCNHCGTSFMTTNSNKKYCSTSCRVMSCNDKKSVNVNKILRNAVYNIDCLQGIKQVKNNSVKTIVTDPPYFLGMTHNGSKGSFVDLAICKPFYESLFKEYKRVLNEKGELYWFTDWRGYAFYYPLLDSFFNVRNLIVWDKISGAGNHYAFTHELIVYCTAEGYVPNKKGTNVWREKGFTSGSQVTNGKKVHSTQKPLELIERIILDSTEEGDLVLDTFCGSGTTAIAARNNNRDFIGFELDEANFLIAENRLKKKHKLGIKKIAV